MLQKFPLDFSLLFKIPVWRIWLDTAQEIVITEHRSEAEAEVYFSAYSLKENKYLMESYSLNLGWWVSIGGVWNGKIIFVLYRDNKNPLHQGFVVFDIRSQIVIWEKGGHTFYEVRQDKNIIISYANQIEPVRMQAWSLETGKEEIRPENPVSEISLWQIPQQYVAGSKHFTTVNTFLQQNLHTEAVKCIDYLETENRILLGYYSENENYYLGIWDLNGVLLEHILLYKQALTGILDPFLVFKNSLFIVKNKIELLSYDLNIALGAK